MIVNTKPKLNRDLTDEIDINAWVTGEMPTLAFSFTHRLGLGRSTVRLIVSCLVFRTRHWVAEAGRGGLARTSCGNCGIELFLPVHSTSVHCENLCPSRHPIPHPAPTQPPVPSESPPPFPPFAPRPISESHSWVSVGDWARWSAAYADIKIFCCLFLFSFLRIYTYHISPCKAWGRSEYSSGWFTYCQEFRFSDLFPLSSFNFISPQSSQRIIIMTMYSESDVCLWFGTISFRPYLCDKILCGSFE